MTNLPRLPLAALLSFAAALAAFVVLRGPEPATPAPAIATAARAAGSTDAEIARLQSAVRADPRAGAPRVALAAAYLQKARETGDPGFYSRADGLLRAALARRPGEPDALVASAGLALSRHDFRRGLELARRARAARPEALAPYPGARRRARRARPLPRGRARAPAHGRREADARRLRARLLPARAARRPRGRGRRDAARHRGRRPGARERRRRAGAAGRDRARARPAGRGACRAPRRARCGPGLPGRRGGARTAGRGARRPARSDPALARARRAAAASRVRARPRRGRARRRARGGRAP